MRKLVMALILCLIPNLSFAGGSVTFVKGGLMNGVREYKWTAAYNGADTTITGGQTDPIYGFVVGAYLYPGTITDTSWTLTLTDGNSFDWLFGYYSGTNTLGTSVKVLCPLDANMVYPRLQGQRLNLNGASLALTAGTFYFYLYVREE